MYIPTFIYWAYGQALARNVKTLHFGPGAPASCPAAWLAQLSFSFSCWLLRSLPLSNSPLPPVPSAWHGSPNSRANSNMTFGAVSAASMGLKWAGTAARAPFSHVAYICFWVRKLSKLAAFWATCAPLKMKMGSLRTSLWRQV